MAVKFEQVAAVLGKLAEEVANKKEWLVELDSAIGDGDLGLTMDRGFSALANAASEYSEDDIGKFFMTGGLTFNKVAPSTMGTLVSTGIMRMGKEWKGKTELTRRTLLQDSRPPRTELWSGARASWGIRPPSMP